ncbi:MAG: hypothetical protein FWD04_02195 [Conexibacteraceae bacterium]|nr:hypothetical protein [Conexibacteraceae bacterium]
MPKTQAQWISLLRSDGWRQETGGKHQVKMTKTGMRPVTLPDNHRRAYSKGFEAQLRRETRLDRKPPSRGRDSRRRREDGLDR